MSNMAPWILTPKKSIPLAPSPIFSGLRNLQVVLALGNHNVLVATTSIVMVSISDTTHDNQSLKMSTIMYWLQRQ